MRHLCATALIIASLTSAISATNDPSQSSTRRAPDVLVSGVQISVELRDGQQLSGTVGELAAAGFWIEHPPLKRLFIRYIEYDFERDLQTGFVIGRPSAYTPSRRLLKVILITAGVIVGLAIATHGVIPGCLFGRCYR